MLEGGQGEPVCRESAKIQYDSACSCTLHRLNFCLIAGDSMRPPFKLLFVCMGNICRSPAAEGVMHHYLRQAGLNDQVQLDSAGTGGWHAGSKADPRMRKHAALRGYELESSTRTRFRGV